MPCLAPAVDDHTTHHHVASPSPTNIQIALIWGLLASACCIFYPIVEAGSHILNILSHLVRCQTAESRDDAIRDAAKDVLPPQDMVGAHPLK